MASRRSPLFDGVNPRLLSLIQRVQQNYEPYELRITSGYRPGDKRLHGRGSAIDVMLVDRKTGETMPNYQNNRYAAQYQQLANRVYEEAKRTDPDLAAKLRWGGYFGGAKGKYGAFDLMHFDVGGPGKMAGGSWEKGFTPEMQKIWKLAGNFLDPLTNVAQGVGDALKRFPVAAMDLPRQIGRTAVDTGEAIGDVLTKGPQGLMERLQATLQGPQGPQGPQQAQSQPTPPRTPQAAASLMERLQALSPNRLDGGRAAIQAAARSATGPLEVSSQSAAPGIPLPRSRPEIPPEQIPLPRERPPIPGIPLPRSRPEGIDPGIPLPRERPPVPGIPLPRERPEIPQEAIPLPRERPPIPGIPLPRERPESLPRAGAEAEPLVKLAALNSGATMSDAPPIGAEPPASAGRDTLAQAVAQAVTAPQQRAATPVPAQSTPIPAQRGSTTLPASTPLPAAGGFTPIPPAGVENTGQAVPSVALPPVPEGTPLRPGAQATPVTPRMTRDASSQVANPNLDQLKRAFLRTIASGESPRYNMMFGGKDFSDYSRHPGQAQTVTKGNTSTTSTAAGLYQFLKKTWDEQAAKHGYKDFKPETQDLAAWNYASEVYKQQTGRELTTDLADPAKRNAIGDALKNVWPSLPGGSQTGPAWQGKQFSQVFDNFYNDTSGGGGSTAAPATDTSGGGDVTPDAPSKGFGGKGLSGVGDIFSALGGMMGGKQSQEPIRSGPTTIPAASLPTPASPVSMIDAKRAEMQRQQLAQAIARLNSGRLF